MMLRYTKRFLKHFRKLPKKDQIRVEHTLILFQKNPFHPLLRNHELQREMEGARAISAGFDLRIIYREEGNHTIVFLLQVGTHNQLY